jgi:hypothetical protein
MDCLPIQEKENSRFIYERERRKTLCQLLKPKPETEYQCRALLLGMGVDEVDGGTRGWWGHGRPMGAASHRPHARSFRPMGAVSRQMPQKPPGQIPSQHVRENDSSCKLFFPATTLQTRGTQPRHFPCPAMRKTPKIRCSFPSSTPQNFYRFRKESGTNHEYDYTHERTSHHSHENRQTIIARWQANPVDD